MKIRKRSIAYQLYSLYAFIILSITVVFLCGYSLILNISIKNNIEYTSQVFNQIGDKIENKSELLENLLMNTGYNRSVFRYLVAEDNSERFDLMKELDSLSVSAVNIEPKIQEVIIECSNGVSYYSNGKRENISQVLENTPMSNSTYYNFSDEIVYNSRFERNFIISTPIYDIWKLLGKKLQIRISFVVDMDILEIWDYEDKQDMTLLIMDRDNNICCCNKEYTDELNQLLRVIQLSNVQERRDVEIDEEKYIVNACDIPSIDATLYGITLRKNVVDSVNWIGKYVYLLLLIVYAMIILMFCIFHQNFIKPWRKLGHFMERMRKEDQCSLQRTINLEGYREIEEISNQFNRMIVTIDDLNNNLLKTTETLYETQLQKKQAELLFLKSQINPHFIFNTLEVILGIAYTEDAPKTAQMIKSLAKIFKYCVRGEDMVTMEEELKMVESYTYIQQTRFYQLLNVVYQIDDAVLSQHIPKMLLQPIIENAIIHGIEKKGTGGTVSIGAELRNEEEFHLWIEDDGIGMSQEKLEQLRNFIKEDFSSRSDCIGFENVIHRIQLIYSKDCNIELESEIGKGTRVDITLPSDASKERS